MLSRTVRTILEKAAVDNGFSLDGGISGGWFIWKAHAAPARLCLTVTESGYGIGSDHLGAVRNLEFGLPELPDAPPGFLALQVPDSGVLNIVAGAIWRLARSLPDEPLRQYQLRLTEPPAVTEVERFRKERIGQDVFREALMLFWDRACAVTRVSHPRLLRASHIIPWAECKSDAERLDVRNGLLLAAHLDAAFDAHLISFDSGGRVMFSPLIPESDRAVLHLHPEMCLRRVDRETERRLEVHRASLRI